MNLNTGILFFVIAMSTNLRATTGDSISCWDQTFAYNTARINTTDEGHEIILSGSSLHGDEIRTIDGTSFPLSNSESGVEHWRQLQILLRLPLGDCQIDTIALTAVCNTNFELNPRNWRDRVFVSFSQSDISQSIEARQPIVPITYGNRHGQLINVNVSIKDTGAVLSLTSQSSGDHQIEIQNIKVVPYEITGHRPSLSCTDGTVSNMPRTLFPERLREFLNNQGSQSK